jgi:hypothetical protein
MSEQEILTYMKTPRFRDHIRKIIALYDGGKMYIDDAQQDFFVYYKLNPHLRCNIRKLYNLVIDELRRDGKKDNYGTIEDICDFGDPFD